MKLVRDDGEWAAGRNYVLHAGDRMSLEPCFENDKATLSGPFEIEHDGGTITYEVLLPPSYAEQEKRRYPVLYAVDGQSLWSTSSDPFGVWHLDTELSRLYELDAIEEVIVVGIHTALGRVEMLSPVPDPKHGGGNAKALLAAIVDRLKPRIDGEYRTLPDRRNTAMLGSSMGGLFAFGAGWDRPDVFGKVACLSSSFWWADRHVVKQVQNGSCPEPRPLIYIDSARRVSSHTIDVSRPRRAPLRPRKRPSLAGVHQRVARPRLMARAHRHSFAALVSCEGLSREARLATGIRRQGSGNNEILAVA